MKKWIIILFIICGIGTLTSAALAGHIYFKGMKQVHETKNIDLNKDNLSSIVINASIPVKVKRTEGNPHIEITEYYKALLGEPYQYRCDVEEKVGKSIITITTEQQEVPNMFIGEDYKVITVYLPDQAIDNLSIKSGAAVYGWWESEGEIDLQDIDIKNLEVNMQGNANIKGNYESVMLEVQGNVMIDSESCKALSVSNASAVELKGNYENVNIIGADNLQIDAEVQNLCNLNRLYGTAELNGRYNTIKISEADQYGNDIIVDSDTAYTIEIENGGSNITLSGKLEQVNITGDSGINIGRTVNIEAECIPKEISVTDTDQGLTNITLPSNIKGIELKAKINQLGDEVYYDGYEVYEEDQQSLNMMNLMSDFELEEREEDGGKIYTYGDGASTKIFVKTSESGQVNILDGGYIVQ